MVPNQVQPERGSRPRAANFPLGEMKLWGRGFRAACTNGSTLVKGRNTDPLQKPSEPVTCFVLEELWLHSSLCFLVPRPPPGFGGLWRGWKPVMPALLAILIITSSPLAPGACQSTLPTRIEDNCVSWPSKCYTASFCRRKKISVVQMRMKSPLGDEDTKTQRRQATCSRSSSSWSSGG